MKILIRSTVAFLAGFAVLGAGGCQSLPKQAGAADSASAIQQPAMAYQFAIKFKPHTVVCDAKGIAQLAGETHLDLHYVRPMSGEACVAKLSAADERAAMAAVAQIKNHPAVAWAEMDRQMKALR
jgi:hypothetical protein